MDKQIVADFEVMKKTQKKLRCKIERRGPVLIRELCVGDGAPFTLRGLSKIISRSPSYLSLVMNKKTPCSIDTFFRLVKVKAKQ